MQTIDKVLIAAALLALALVQANVPHEHPAPKQARTGQEFCTITTPEEDGGASVLCSVIDMKEV